MQAIPGDLPTAGIEQEIAELHERESGGMLRYAASLAPDGDIAHDAVQEAFFKLFLCRSGGQSIAAPKAWLFRVVRNYILDLKKAGCRKAIAMEVLANAPGLVRVPETDNRLSDLLAGLAQCGLSPREIECVRLRAEDLRYDEIAGVLGLQRGTVGALLARAHGKLRKAVDGVSKKRNFTHLEREKRYAS